MFCNNFIALFAIFGFGPAQRHSGTAAQAARQFPLPRNTEAFRFRTTQVAVRRAARGGRARQGEARSAKQTKSTAFRGPNGSTGCRDWGQSKPEASRHGWHEQHVSAAHGCVYGVRRARPARWRRLEAAGQMTGPPRRAMIRPCSGRLWRRPGLPICFP